MIAGGSESSCALRAGGVYARGWIQRRRRGDCDEMVRSISSDEGQVSDRRLGSQGGSCWIFNDVSHARFGVASTAHGQKLKLVIYRYLVVSGDGGWRGG